MQAWGSLLLSISTITLLLIFYNSSIQCPKLLSPQGCRMSYMSPSYILQHQFNATWTRLARRYSLWLYREDGWESPQKLNGLPVLFITGNAGSSRQVRSIASSATRQYYSEPYNTNPEFLYSAIKPLDFFAVEFNEDFSALHGPTLLSERSYTSSAIQYILSLYPPNTKIIVMGHSMGGIVALSLLPSDDISAIITMSTPHSLPPARLDRRIELIYSQSSRALRNDSTPVLSICGGATDLMIPSESCSMHHPGSESVGWRKTVFTTCMEGIWSGVGHREMVWCHQVRWRIARAALELGNTATNPEKAAVLARWFRDEVDKGSLVQSGPLFLGDHVVTRIPAGHRLVLRDLPQSSTLYLLPIPTGSSKFVLYVSRGMVASLSPHHASGLQISVYKCLSSHESCRPLQPQSLKLIPNPAWGTVFPVPEEGVDESDGVVRFEALIGLQNTESEWIGVALQGRGDQRGWVLGGIEREYTVQSNISQYAIIWGMAVIATEPAALTTTIRIPNILSNSLMVYQIAPPQILGSCSGALLPPLVLHQTSPAESHFHSTDGSRPLLIHSHSSGPFISSSADSLRGVDIYIYSSGECGISQLEITIDWWSTLGTWGLRYWTTVFAWAVGVVGIMMAQAWHTWEKGGSTHLIFPSVSDSLARYVGQTMGPLAVILLFASCLPLDATYLLGNSGELALSPLAPLVLVFASGCVTISWTIIQGLMWAMFKAALVFGRLTDEPRVWKRNLWSLGFILLLVTTVVPSQVVFIICFFIHLFTCATRSPSSLAQAENYAQNSHILLLLFWLLPLVAPVLAVWVRTLATAGLTTPFDGDHDVLAIASFLLYVVSTSSSPPSLLEKASSRYLTPTIISSLAVIPFAFGGRYTYRVYIASNAVLGYFILAGIGKKLWRALW